MSEGSNQPFRLIPGLKVWIRNPYPFSTDEQYRQAWLPSNMASRPPWIPGEIVSLGNGPTVDITVTTTLHPRISIRVPSTDVLPMNSVSNLDDLSEFTYLHEATVFHSILRRHLEGQSVTRAGPNIYLQVNPCRIPIDNDGVQYNDPIYMAKYHGRVSNRFLDALSNDKQRALLTLPPHIFEAASKVHNGLGNDLLNQALIFMGDTGSGKTESFKSALQYLLCISSLENQGVRPGTAALTLNTNTAAVIASGRHVELPPVLLGRPDVPNAVRDASTRRGPLGSSRNPFITTPPAFQNNNSSTSSSFAINGSGSTTNVRILPSFSSNTSVLSRNSAERVVDFLNEDPTALLPLSSTAKMVASAAYNTITNNSSLPSSSASSASSSINPIKQLAASIPKFARGLLAAQTVLEAFGSAATATNPNSSRFARSIKLYSDGHGNIVSGSIDAALLEKRRVLGAALDPRTYGIVRSGSSGGTFPGIGLGTPEGRNFHIFYQLLAGAPRDTRSQLQLGSPVDYLCLHQRGVPTSGSPNSTGNAIFSGTGFDVSYGTNSSSTGGSTSTNTNNSNASGITSTTSSSSSSTAPTNSIFYVHGIPLPVRTLGVPANNSIALPNGGGTGGDTISLSAHSTALADGEEFTATCKALSETGIDPSQQVEIFRILSAILMAGNIRFTDSSDGTSVSKGNGETGGALLATPSEAALFADLLGIDRNAFTEVLTKKSRSSAYASNPALRTNSSSPVQRPTTWSYRKATEARQAIDSITIMLYDRLFSQIVRLMNEHIFSTSGGKAMLDAIMKDAPPGQDEPLHLVLFEGCGLEGMISPIAEQRLYSAGGSENYSDDSLYPGVQISSVLSSSSLLSVDVKALRGFDTLCMNYAAERVHDLFLTCVFRGEVALYEAEGVEFSGAAYDDNAHVVDMVDNRRGGLIGVLDEACTFARSTDNAFITNLISLQKRNPALLRPTVYSPLAIETMNLHSMVPYSGFGKDDGMSSSSTALTHSSASSNTNSNGNGYTVSVPGTKEANIVLYSMGTASSISPVSNGASTTISNTAAIAAGYDPSLLFGVRHTGGTVFYSAVNFLNFNRHTNDRLDTDLLSVLQTSTVPFVRELLGVRTDPAFPSNDTNSSNNSSPFIDNRYNLLPSTNGMGPTAISHYIDETSRLLTPLASPSIIPSFVRCLRPNTNLQPGYVDSDLLHNQLVHSGILHALVLHHSGFAYKAAFADFYERYVILVHQRGRLTFPPPRNVELRDLCRELLATIMLHPAFSGMIVDARKNAHFGRNKVLLRRHLADTLESLREARLLTMDRQARIVQAVWKGYLVRRSMTTVWEGVRRMQATFRALRARQEWLRVRYASQTIQAAVKRWLIRRRYLSQVSSAVRIQRWYRNERQLRGWRLIRKGVHNFHALARGYIVRSHVMRMLASVSRLQNVARMFLAATRLKRLKNAVAASLQATWKGYRFRVDHEEVLAYLAVKREVRTQNYASSLIQASWRAQRVRRQFLALRSRAIVLQRWYGTHLQQRKYLSTLNSIVFVQALIRRYLATLRVRRIRSLREVADELWRVHNVRSRELVELAKATAEDCLQPLPSAARLVVAAAAGVSAPGSVGSTGSKGNKGVPGTPGTTNPSSASAPVNSGLPSIATVSTQAYNGTLLLDVDTLSDTSLVHPNTLTRAMHSLEMDLRATDTRIAAVGLGSAHAVVVSENGQVYTWGFSDRGQCGHGRLTFESRPRLVESLLNDPANPSTINGSDDKDNKPTVDKSGIKTSASTGINIFTESLARNLTAPLRIRAVACGNEHTIVLSEHGKVYTWGGNRRGQLGLGHNEHTPNPSPVRISLRDTDAASLPGPLSVLQSPSTGSMGSDSLLNDLTRIVEIAAGANHTVALTTAGIVFAWGDGACLGQGVYSGNGDSSTPLPVRSLMRTRVRHISSGPAFVAVVTNSGDVYTWGSGRDGVLGVGEDVYRRRARTTTGTKTKRDGSPVRTNPKANNLPLSPLDPSNTALVLAAATNNTSNEDTDGSTQHEFVVGKFRSRFVPTLVEAFATYEKHSRIANIACGANHCVAVSSTGRVYTWGSNSHGQLGLGTVGPVTEDIFRRHGVANEHIPKLPLHLQKETVGSNGKPIIQPRPYAATPVWVSSLEHHHSVSVVAGARSCTILTDMREAFAWGVTTAPWTTVDHDTLLVRAANSTRSLSPTGSRRTTGTENPSGNNNPNANNNNNNNNTVISRILSSPSGSASLNGTASVAAAKSAAAALVHNPIYLAETGRGPSEICIFPFPTEIPVNAIPGRKATKFISAYSSAESICAVHYNQLPITETILMDAALARAVAPGRNIPVNAVLSALPNPATLMATLLSNTDVSYEPTPAPVPSWANPNSANDRLVNLDPLRSPKSTMKSGSPVRSGTPSVNSSSLFANPTAPATSHLLAALSAVASPDGPSATQATNDRRKALQGALLRGIIGIPDNNSNDTVAPPPLPSNNSNTKSSTLASTATKGGRKSVSTGPEERTTAVPSSSSSTVGRSISPPTGRNAVDNSPVSNTTFQTLVRSVHPSVGRIVVSLARDTAGCAAMMGLSPDTVRSLTPQQINIISERLLELSGGTNPGALAGSAAAASIIASRLTNNGSTSSSSTNVPSSSSVYDSSAIKRAIASGKKVSSTIRSTELSEFSGGNPTNTKTPSEKSRFVTGAYRSNRPTSVPRDRPVPNTVNGNPSSTSNTNVNVMKLFMDPISHKQATPSSVNPQKTNNYFVSPTSTAQLGSPSANTALVNSASNVFRRPIVAPLVSSVSTLSTAISPNDNTTRNVSPSSVTTFTRPSPRPLTVRDMLYSSANTSSMGNTAGYIPSPLTGTNGGSSSGFGNSTTTNAASITASPLPSNNLSKVLEDALATAAMQSSLYNNNNSNNAATLSYLSTGNTKSSPGADKNNGMFSSSSSVASPFPESKAVPSSTESNEHNNGSMGNSFSDEPTEDIAAHVASLQRQLEAVRLRSAAVMALAAQQPPNPVPSVLSSSTFSPGNTESLNNIPTFGSAFKGPLLPPTPSNTLSSLANSYLSASSTAPSNLQNSYLSHASSTSLGSMFSPYVPVPPTPYPSNTASSAYSFDYRNANPHDVVSRLQADLSEVSSKVDAFISNNS